MPTQEFDNSPRNNPERAMQRQQFLAQVPEGVQAVCAQILNTHTLYCQPWEIVNLARMISQEGDKKPGSGYEYMFGYLLTAQKPQEVQKVLATLGHLTRNEQKQDSRMADIIHFQKDEFLRTTTIELSKRDETDVILTTVVRLWNGVQEIDSSTGLPQFTAEKQLKDVMKHPHFQQLVSGKNRLEVYLSLLFDKEVPLELRRTLLDNPLQFDISNAANYELAASFWNLKPKAILKKTVGEITEEFIHVQQLSKETQFSLALALLGISEGHWNSMLQSRQWEFDIMDLFSKDTYKSQFNTPEKIQILKNSISTLLERGKELKTPPQKR